MSLQAALARPMLRLFSRNMQQNFDPAVMRSKVEKQAKRMPGLPKTVSVEHFRIGDIPAAWFDTPGNDPSRVVLYLHGGGYMFCSAFTTHRDLLWRLSQAAECRVLAIDYRLAPEHPFPAAVDDAVEAYAWLLNEGFHPEGLAIAGDSAGGGLAFGTALKLRDDGFPLPAALVGLSPWTDLAATGVSVVKNAKKDPLIPGAGLREGAEFYLQGTDPKTPYASPLYGDLRGLPPTLLQVSSDEVLLDDSRRLAAKMKAAGVPVVLDVWDGLPHVWQALAMLLPEGRAAIRGMGRFLQGHMKSHLTR